MKTSLSSYSERPGGKGSAIVRICPCPDDKGVCVSASENHLRTEPNISLTTLEEDGEFGDFLTSGGRGLRFVPEVQASDAVPTLASDGGDFAKWLRQTHPTVEVNAPKVVARRVLRSADVWLPLVYLAGDTSLQIFLNMVASYLYDRAKGSLKGDKAARVHLKATFQDKSSGKTKRFEFEGDGETLAKTIKRLDLNEFFDDSAP